MGFLLVVGLNDTGWGRRLFELVFSDMYCIV